MRKIQNMQMIIFLPLVIAVIIALSSCAASKGSIVILENPNGTGFTMDFNAWSTKNKCELSLKKGDILQIEITRDDGVIALTINGKDGGEPYTGNDLKSGIFTVTVSETDKYVFDITGRNATGNITVENVGRK